MLLEVHANDLFGAPLTLPLGTRARRSNNRRGLSVIRVDQYCDEELDGFFQMLNVDSRGLAKDVKNRT